MKISKNAFTMIEMIFVIVVLGILASVAIPKMAATRTDAQISKARADIASIRSAIVTERQSRLIRGDSSWINKLHSSSTSFFDGNGTASTDAKLLMYGIKPEDKDGHWHTPDTSGSLITYNYKIEGSDNLFAYNPTNSSVTHVPSSVSVPSGAFVCVSGSNCDQLTK